MTIAVPLPIMTEPTENLSPEQRLDRIEAAIDTLVVDFLRPLAQQSVENQRTIAALIESNNRHQDWLDSDRIDINQQRADHNAAVETLLGEARADRQHTSEKFSQLQSEIRQNQRLLLANQEKLEANEKRLEATLVEVLSLSRRVTAVEDAA